LLLSRGFGDPYDRTGHEFHIWETPGSSGSHRQENLQELCSESHAEVLTWLKYCTWAEIRYVVAVELQPGGGLKF